MANRADIEDRKLTTRLFVAIVVLIAAAGAALLLFAGPAVAELVAPGVGLRTAALASFVVTLVVIVVLAIAAGDSLIGEIQFMLPGFAGFFLVLWFLIAWIF